MIETGNVVEKALAFAAVAYSGQSQELSGIPTIIHICESVVLMSGIDPVDRDLMAAAALWNITDRTEVTWEEIEETFGTRLKGILQSTHLETARPEMDPEDAPDLKEETPVQEVKATLTLKDMLAKQNEKEAEQEEIL